MSAPNYPRNEREANAVLADRIRPIYRQIGPAVGQYMPGAAQQVSSDHLRAVFERVRSRQARQHANPEFAMSDADRADFEARR